MLIQYRLCTLFCIMMLSAFARSPTLAQEETDIDPSPMRIELRHIENKGVGYNTGYTTLEAFLAPSANKITPFLDLRGHVFDDGKFAANTGVGFRLLNGCRVYGVNAYYDYRHTKRHHYNQVSLGFETMGIRWDFRVNGYFPVGSKKSNPYHIQTSITNPSFDSFIDHAAIIRQTSTTNSKVEFAMTGGDAEAAYHILKNKNIDFYAAAGPYYYNYKNKQAIGGKVRFFAKIFKYLSLELINSYDSRFHENIQGSIGLNIPFGKKANTSKSQTHAKCKDTYLLNQRLFQDVERQEIIVVDQLHQKTSVDIASFAINPLTNEPYYFVFVNNTSSSLGTYESPYPTLALAEANSSPNDIIYVFPGDGTTKGMDSGIFLQPNQKLWGSGVTQLLQTSKGSISIPPQSSTYPTITNTNLDTTQNAITLAKSNAISGLHITSSLNDAIYGADAQNLEVSSCIFDNTTLYTIEAYFSKDASISIMDNQFVNNINGISLQLNGTSNLICSNNTFKNQASESEQPLKIICQNNTFSTHIENNVFDTNFTGSIAFNLSSVSNADIVLLNNIITNNSTGSESTSGSSVVISSLGTIDRCSLVLEDNTFSDNRVELGGNSASLYFLTNGEIKTLEVVASRNTMSNNVGSSLVLATPVVDNLTLVLTDNRIEQITDNAIAVIASGVTSTGNITINNNTITDVTNSGNAISIEQSFSTLNLDILNNEINRCEGTGISMYPNSGNDTLILNISGNTISNCQNNSSNASSGIDIEQYTNLVGSIANNTLSNNASAAFFIGSTLTSPKVCLTLTGNNNDQSYQLNNPSDGVFNLSPCNVDAANIGTIDTLGTTITSVQGCPDATLCPP